MPESDFRLFTQMSVFDKIFHVDEMSSSDTAAGDDKLKKKLPLAERLMKFGSLAKKLEKGLEHRYSKVWFCAPLCDYDGTILHIWTVYIS